MALVKVKDILRHATDNKYGVAAVNTLNIETIKYIIMAAEEERMPVIVQFYPGFSDYLPLKYIAYAACDLAKKASVPVGVHLDHSNTFEIAMAGIRDGFPSVMVDGSSLEFEANIKLTNEIVNISRIFDIDVEAELGHVGSGDNISDIKDSEFYTKVEQAQEFIDRTGCDSLAVAVGNAHGTYVKAPSLDFDRIQMIREKVRVPLVLHGCSDIPEDQIVKAVNLGMSKFNIATEYFRELYISLEKNIEKSENKDNGVLLMMSIKDDMIGFVREKIKLLNPNRYYL